MLVSEILCSAEISLCKQLNKKRRLIFAVLVFVIYEINPLVAKRTHLFLKAENRECTLEGLKFCGF